MKDRIAHVHARAVPYAATPRRPLHAAENATLAGRSVRQANNPACRLPQYLPPFGAAFEECNEYIGTIECVPALRSFFVQSPPYSPTNNPNTKYITCAKVACDNNLPNIRKADVIPITLGGQPYNRLNDTRCFIAFPPNYFTMPLIDEVGNDAWHSGDVHHPYRNIVGTGSYEPAPLVLAGAVYPGPGVIHDIDSSKCAQGARDPVVAREIQREVGLTAALGATAAACLLPTPTAVIAAAASGASTATVTGLAVTLGLAGSAAVIGGAIYAGYKLVQHCKSETQVIPDTQVMSDAENSYRTYEEINLSNINLNEHIIGAPENVLENPFNRPVTDQQTVIN